jgi:uncharacterized membrane protein
MIYVPVPLTNALLLFTAYLSGIQYVRLVKNHMAGWIQLGLILFCIVMMVATALLNRTSPWLSWLFLAIGVACVLLMQRNKRFLPPLARRI